MLRLRRVGEGAVVVWYAGGALLRKVGAIGTMGKRKPGQKAGIDWDTQPLGEYCDNVIAESIGVSCASVGAARRARGIKALVVPRAIAPDAELTCDRCGVQLVRRPTSENKWQFSRRRYCSNLCHQRDKAGWPRGTGEAISCDKRLGAVPDTALAKEYGVPSGAVRSIRIRLAVPTYGNYGTSAKNINWDEQPLGYVYDLVLAKRLGVCHPMVGYERRLRGIPKHIGKRPSKCGDPDWKNLGLKQKTNAEVARQLGVSPMTVSRHRERLGLPLSHDPRLGRVNWDEQPYGRVSDGELATALGVTTSIVQQHRAARGITGWQDRVAAIARGDGSANNVDALPIHTCACGAEFIATTKHKKYCSTECLKSATYAKVSGTAVRLIEVHVALAALRRECKKQTEGRTDD